MNTIAERIAASLGLDAAAVAATLALFDDGATVPFVARYRKERTGGLDEEQLRAVRSESTRLMELDSRRESILAGMRERGQLTAALEGGDRGGGDAVGARGYLLTVSTAAHDPGRPRP